MGCRTSFGLCCLVLALGPGGLRAKAECAPFYDSLNDAEDLAALLKGLKTNVNLIEYNPHAGAKFKPSGSAKTKAFKDALMTAGIETIIRFRRGREIMAACGQLGAARLEGE